MPLTKGPLRWGANFVALSGVLHIAAPFLSGFSGFGLGLAGLGVTYLAMAYGLFQNMRWVGYIAFLVMFIGLSAAIGNIWSAGPVPGWLFVAIAAANICAVVTLFIALWRAPPTSAG